MGSVSQIIECDAEPNHAKYSKTTPQKIKKYMKKFSNRTDLKKSAKGWFCSLKKSFFHKSRLGNLKTKML